MTEMTTSCAATVGCKRHPTHGLLCAGHMERLASIIREIEDETAVLSTVPSMALRTGSGGGSLASERAPARLDAIAFRDPRTRRWWPDEERRYIPPAAKAIGPWCLFCEHETCVAWRAGRRRDLHDDEHDAGSAGLASVLEELHNWARLIREERDLVPPDSITITTERAFLTRHLDWLVDQPYVDEAYRDLTELLGRLRSINGTAPEKPVGRCYLPSPDDEAGGICNGPIWVDDAEGHAYCGDCRSTWDGPQLLLLKKQLELDEAERRRPRTEDGRRMLTAEEISEQQGISVNAVRLRLSKAGARATSGSYYDPLTVEDTQQCEAV